MEAPSSLHWPESGETIKHTTESKIVIASDAQTLCMLACHSFVGVMVENSTLRESVTALRL